MADPTLSPVSISPSAQVITQAGNQAFTTGNTHAGTETFGGAITLNGTDAYGVAADGYMANMVSDFASPETHTVTLAGSVNSWATANRGAGRRLRVLIKSLVDGTFSRGSTAYDPYSGALIASGIPRFPQPQNNLAVSSELRNANWFKVGAVSYPYYGQVPPGYPVVDVLAEDTSTGLHGAGIVSTTYKAASPGTFSALVKPYPRTACNLTFDNFGAQYATYALTGAGTATPSGIGVTAGIQALQDGWYFIWIVATSVTSGIPRITLSSGGTNNYAGDGISGILVAGLQPEQTSAPTGLSPIGVSVGLPAQGLLVEQAATNIAGAALSQGISGWGNGGPTNAATWTVNDTTHAWGAVTTAAKAVCDGTAASQGGVTGSPFVAVAASTQYTAALEVFAPAGALMSATLQDSASGVGAVAINFIGTGAYQKIQITITTGASTAHLELAVYTNGAQALTFWVTAFQVELGAYSTSWTLGGGTRAAETWTVPNTTVGPSAGALAGRFYVDGDQAAATSLASHFMFDVGSAVGGGRIFMLSVANSPTAWYIGMATDAGVLTQADWISGLAVGWHMFLVRWNNGNAYLYVDGVQRTSLSSASSTSFANPLCVGRRLDNSNYWDQHCAWLATFKSDPGDAAACAYTNLHDPSVPARLSLAADYFIDFGSVSQANGGNLAPTRKLAVNSAWNFAGTVPVSLYSGREALLGLTSFGTAETDVFATYRSN